MDNKELLKRSARRHELAKTAESEDKFNNLFGKPTPGGESMMLSTRQCPECQGQAGPVPGKEGYWQCSICGSVYLAAKGSPAEQLPFDAEFYGAGGALMDPSKPPHRNTASVDGKLVRKADFRGSVSQFIVNVRDAINNTASAEDKAKIEQVLGSAFDSGDLNLAIKNVYEAISVPVEEMEISSEEIE